MYSGQRSRADALCPSFAASKPGLHGSAQHKGDGKSHHGGHCTHNDQKQSIWRINGQPELKQLHSDFRPEQETKHQSHSAEMADPGAAPHQDQNAHEQPGGHDPEVASSELMCGQEQIAEDWENEQESRHRSFLGLPAVYSGR
ncbi:MAG: hypothetical protein R6U22_08085 [Desulfohalobiaceae bacterium]